MENMRSALAILVICLLLVPAAALAAGNQYIVYVGTYTRGMSKGIYAYNFDSSSGALSPIGLAAEVEHPSFLTIHHNLKNLYAISEITRFNGEKVGSVSSYAMDRKTGKLTPLNRVSSAGSLPCHLVVDKTGKNLLLVNYISGSSAVLKLNPDGSLGAVTSVVQHKGTSADPRRQKGPHAHSINLSFDNRFAIVPDLGLDELIVYKFDPAAGTITANDPPFATVKPGSGPRHFAFHPGNRFAYVINEMGSAVTAFSWDGAKGVLTELQTISTLPPDFKGENNSAHVEVHPSGKFVYASNRGHDSITGFTVAKAKGTLKLIGQTSTQGKTPRNFGIDPTGKFMIAVNQDTNNMIVYRIDQNTGKLTPTGQNLEVGAPVCVKYVPVN
jgi:6-phosphogluconolactonase